MAFTQEQVSTFKAAICERLVSGQSLRAITRDPDMPSAATVFKWLAEDPDFVEQYARAREAQADTLVDEMLDIVDDGRNDWMERLDKEDLPIGWQINGEAVQRSRLRLDARKWMASKMAPKKYGDKVEQNITGADGGPIEINVTIGGNAG